MINLSVGLNKSGPPAGQSKEKYLNDNYEKLPGASAYTWYQAIMIVDADKEDWRM